MKQELEARDLISEVTEQIMRVQAISRREIWERPPQILELLHARVGIEERGEIRVIATSASLGDFRAIAQAQHPTIHRLIRCLKERPLPW